ncbi:tetratricopeptide (TPR) repeat protein [Streptomyces sp. V1I1]|nr:tetratricopeptide (TPR) repeat protein [Streptomyces sp. V1I1]
MNRWLGRHDPHRLDCKGLYLYGRSLVLLGDLQRDQGAVLGPLSARQSYLSARGMFTELDIPRRVAQIELSLAVVQEMSGQLEASARHYELLAADERLSPRDRARARLWVGTALSKEGDNEYATNVMTAATRAFEDLGEPEDWSVAHQKLALAHRGAGDLKQALHYIDIARTTGLTGARQGSARRGSSIPAGRAGRSSYSSASTTAAAATGMPCVRFWTRSSTRSTPQTACPT